MVNISTAQHLIRLPHINYCTVNLGVFWGERCFWGRSTFPCISQWVIQCENIYCLTAHTVSFRWAKSLRESFCKSVNHKWADGLMNTLSDGITADFVFLQCFTVVESTSDVSNLFHHVKGPILPVYLKCRSMWSYICGFKNQKLCQCSFAPPLSGFSPEL